MHRLSTLLLTCAMLLTVIPLPAKAAPAKPATKKTVAIKSPRQADEDEYNAAMSGAKALFAKYVALEHAYDPALGNLYAPNAQIVTTGISGQKVQFDGGMMKEMIKQSMPIAKARKDSSDYKNTTYTKNGDFVYIKSTRHSNLKNCDTPHLLVVASSDGGKNWYIVQELAQSTGD